MHHCNSREMGTCLMALKAGSGSVIVNEIKTEVCALAEGTSWRKQGLSCSLRS